MTMSVYWAPGLHTEMMYPSTDDHHSGTNWSWHWPATLWAQGQHWQPIRDPFKLTSPAQHALRQVISFLNFLA